MMVLSKDIEYERFTNTSEGGCYLPAQYLCQLDNVSNCYVFLVTRKNGTQFVDQLNLSSMKKIYRERREEHEIWTIIWQSGGGRVFTSSFLAANSKAYSENFEDLLKSYENDKVVAKILFKERRTVRENVPE